MRYGGRRPFWRTGSRVKAIVLAGGLGTRLSGIIRDMPKPMAVVGSRPFLAYLLDYLVDQNIQAVVLAVSYRWEIIREYFGDEYRGMPLTYSVEAEPLGTGGGIRCAMNVLSDEEVVVVNGDTLFKVELENMLKQHRASRAQLTIALKQVPDSGRFGHVDITPDGVIDGFLEKSAAGPGLINGGVYVLNRHLLDEFPMPARFSFERDLLEPNLATIRPRGYLSDAYFIDMGVPDDYERAQNEVGGS
jgi:D-glycero-alpha-D-manno-heptose 1-phosphate guanylyltransferase